MWLGNYWIIPGFETIKASGTEHALLALTFMLKLAPDTQVPNEWVFGAVPKPELLAAKKRGVDKKTLAFLATKTHDPRRYVIEQYGWIRWMRGKANVWKFDDETLDAIRASDLWKFEDVDEYAMVDFDELSTNETFSVSVKKIRNRSAEAGAIKHLATEGVGKFGYNPRNTRTRA